MKTVSFHPIQIGDAIRVGFGPTDGGRWGRGIAEPWPLRERAKFAFGRTITSSMDSVDLELAPQGSWYGGEIGFFCCLTDETSSGVLNLNIERFTVRWCSSSKRQA
jgi:hypothetical protein